MVKIKICGLTRAEDYRQAVILGAAYVGFIFYPASPRYLSPSLAATLCLPVEIATQFPHQRVGVFVNESIEQVQQVYETVGLDIVQLHGDESPRYVEQLGLPCWKVIHVQAMSSLLQMDNFSCDTFLLDTYAKDSYGGTGISFPLEIARAAVATGKRIIVSGGISAQNIGTVMASGCSFYAVDVNSAVEESPGKKSRVKLEDFFSTMRQRIIS
jgi:phosphoribosylanthranilate isomerase